MVKSPITLGALLALLALGSAACRTAGSAADGTEATGASAQDPQNPAAEDKPYDPRIWDKGPPDPLGVFLAKLDKSIRAWNNLTLTARTPGERGNARKIQKVLMGEVHARESEVIEALQSGPPRNRAIAAGALGFSASKAAQGPLLVALGDTDPAVVQNAALSLALLEDPKTPLEPLVEVLASHRNGQARANAAYALRTILEAGAKPTADVTKVAHGALIDDEPFVRAQAALVVALAGAGECVPDLAEMLAGREPLVVSAAAQALAALGHGDKQLLGPCARALVAGLASVSDEQQPMLVRALVVLSGQNLGQDPEPWNEWAQRLP